MTTDRKKSNKPRGKEFNFSVYYNIGEFDCLVPFISYFASYFITLFSKLKSLIDIQHNIHIKLHSNIKFYIFQDKYKITVCLMVRKKKIVSTLKNNNFL